MHKRFKFLGFDVWHGFSCWWPKAYILSDGKLYRYSAENAEVKILPFDCDILDFSINSSNNNVYAISRKNVFICDVNYQKFKLIPALTNKKIIKVVATSGVVLALSSDKKIYLKGDNTYGQLCYSRRDKVGGAEYNEVYFPDKNIIQVANSGVSILLLCDDGEVLGWGDNAFGQLGFQNTNNQSFYTSPKIINISQAVAEKIIRISMGSHSTLFLGERGNVYACGSNLYGQLGLGHCQEKISLRKVPVANIKKIYMQECSSLILDEKNKLHACGFNLYGDLGLGHTEKQTFFAPLNFQEEVLFVQPRNNIAYTKTDELMVWGLNSWNKLFIKEFNNNHPPQKVATNTFTEALKNMFRNKLKHRPQGKELLGVSMFRKTQCEIQSDIQIKALRF